MLFGDCMQQLMSYMRSAMEKYHMVNDGDVIAVGVSGGKDSVALLCALAQMRRFYPAKYKIIAITLDPCFLNEDADYSEISVLCEKLGVDYYIKRTKLYHVVFEERGETNPCSLCARMRRGLLHDTAKELGCNKIALGHHMDDAAETFMMNLLNNGTMACFAPVSYLSRKDLYMIRPMIFAHEKDIIKAVKKEGLPIVKSTCPADGVTEREETKKLIAQLSQKYQDLPAKITGALQRAHINNW